MVVAVSNLPIDDRAGNLSSFKVNFVRDEEASVFANASAARACSVTGR